MKIVYLAAGAGGMYCGSCLHDNTLAAALLALGEEVILTPTYTPIRTDEENVSDAHLFFGGINVFLQQRLSLFRHTPWFLDDMLNHPGILEWVTRGGPSVEAQKLGDLTLSMVRGEHGRQRKEIKKLVHWLASEARPDIVHLSNAMLIGAAREIRKLGVPVVATLSGEDIFLDKLIDPFRSQTMEALRERVAEIDAFVALNRYYADYVTGYMGVPRERIHVVPHGLNLAGHGKRADRRDGHFNVGYLARICPDKGLHNLVEAAELLMADQRAAKLRIRVAGYLSEQDRPYLDTIRRRVAQWKTPDRFEYVGEVTRAEKIEFLQGLDCMSLPTVYRESKGLSVLEALANAVPVVLPDHGTFGEVIEATGGGLLHEPENARSLADALARLMADPAQASEMGLRGQRVVRRDYTAKAMAEKTLALYREVLARGAAPLGR